MAKGDTDWQTIRPAPIEEDRRIEFQGRQVFEIGVDGQRRSIELEEALGPHIDTGRYKMAFRAGDKVVLVQRDGQMLPLLTEQRNLGRLAEVGFPVTLGHRLAEPLLKALVHAGPPWLSSS